MDNVEKELCKIFNKKYCCFTGSGTTSIYLILEALNLKNKKVLYPAITCTNPINSAIYAGYDVVVCDVNLQDYTIDLDSLEYMTENHDIGVVVPTHIYGNRCSIDKIKEICKKKDIFILEDAAQSTYFDEVADASVISFGHTKIFENDFGGGAIFTNNKQLFLKVKELKQTLKPKPLQVDKLFNEYRNSYYSIVNSENSIQEKNQKLYELQLNSKNIFLFDQNAHASVLKSIKNNNSVELRKQKAMLYANYLDEIQVVKPKVDFSQTVPWRYSFLFKGDRDKLLNLVRNKNIDISSWYINTQHIYTPNSYDNLINAQYIENHIVNLWVDSSHDQEKILNNIKIINELMKGI
ncbi:DegT/DnrJ/EryC1/StrS aminotransferase family [Clostridium botulinum C str. Eklund]|nr:DegT/DnrJ/EryC1/StrS aminotransferase family [Clostridium botulinum C str. Eklund]NEZ48432.1 aminotransferase DegT [Clostridium botulinum]